MIDPHKMVEAIDLAVSALRQSLAKSGYLGAPKFSFAIDADGRAGTIRIDEFSIIGQATPVDMGGEG